MNSSTKNNPALPPEVIRAIEQGRKIEAIKLLRTHQGLGLKQAGERIEDA